MNLDNNQHTLVLKPEKELKSIKELQLKRKTKEIHRNKSREVGEKKKNEAVTYHWLFSNNLNDLWLKMFFYKNFPLPLLVPSLVSLGFWMSSISRTSDLKVQQEPSQWKFNKAFFCRDKSNQGCTVPSSPIATMRPYLKYPEGMQFFILVSLDKVKQMCASDWPAWTQ